MTRVDSLEERIFHDFCQKKNALPLGELTRTERIAKNKIHARKQRLSPEEQWKKNTKLDDAHNSFIRNFINLNNNVYFDAFQNRFLNFLIHKCNEAKIYRFESNESIHDSSFLFYKNLIDNSIILHLLSHHFIYISLIILLFRLPVISYWAAFFQY